LVLQISAAQPPQYEEPKAEAVKVEQIAQDEVLKVVAEGRKANWDLKRDLEKSLAKLERRTQRALIELAQQEQHL
jgi:coiled-coil domain-containing protein 12